jgi:geranylgeranyl diphosphate synthase, type II
MPLIQSYLQDSIQRYRSTVSMRLGHLIEAMDYGLGGSGKRLRPLLLLAAAEYLDIPAAKVMPAACAVEFIHTYSLIHDDLPALDDDDMRRGKPSSHIKFGEAMAILTGDGLLTEAFGQMLKLGSVGGFKSDRVVDALEALSHYAGVHGLVGGQVLDVTTDDSYTLPEVEFIHIHKTGALILCSVLIPARLAGVDSSKMEGLRRYGEAVGLAFQISDDLLDSDASIRYSREPRSKPKPSYTRLMSPSEMRGKLNALVDTATRSLNDDGKRAEPLRAIAEFIRNRKH